MDLIKQIETKYIPEWIPYPERYVPQREEMGAYERYYKMYHQYYHAELIIFI